MDAVIQQLIQKFNISIVGVAKLYKIENMRDDYLRESHSSYDMWPHNSDWKVSPTIFFVDGYPRVLTFNYHYGG